MSTAPTTTSTAATGAIDAAAMATAVRFLAADMVDAANSGHPGLPLGMADVATVLWNEQLRFDADHPDWADRDRFVLSAGHGSALLYALAWLSGTEGVELDHLRRFRQLASPAAGHPEYGHFPSVETTTGPLGQGIANAVGMAIAERRLRAEFGAELCDHATWVIAGDGCLMEGISQEAISLAGHLCLDRLNVLWDDNRITIDGPTELSTSEDQLARFAAAGWETLSVDGHDHAAISEALRQARAADRPTLVACRTTIGQGAPTKAGNAGIHGSPLGADERAAMADALGWPHAPFEMPDELLAAWRDNGRRGAAERSAWEARVAATSAAFSERLAQPITPAADEALAALRADLLAERPNQATRVSGKAALGAITPAMPALFGGSADLSGSNGTRTADHSLFDRATPTGNYLEYGIREHAMAAAMNGIALHGGFVPYGGTFLVFSDYSRPAIRLAALMNLPVVHVLTHDSIGVGEDGPTHQPVEHVCALRAIPNLTVIRPADAVETVDAWRYALASGEPTALILSRQNLAPIERDADRAVDAVAGGAAVVADADADADVVLLGSGSEVAVAIDARRLLAERGIAATVVSVPSLERLAEQPDETRRAILGTAPRVAVEAGIGQAWQRWLRPGDEFVGMDGFGASGPAGALFEHFGITAGAVADTAARLVATTPPIPSPDTTSTDTTGDT